MIPSDEPLRLPAGPGDPVPVGFPIIATVAPLALSGVIWLVTGSAFALLFAVLSPVIAVASMLDGRRANRRRRARDAVVHASAMTALGAELTVRHARLRRSAWQRTPSAGDILSMHGDAGLWPASADTLVSLGAGEVASGVRLEGSTAEDEHRALRDRAAVLQGAPITADAAGGIGIVGPPALARALGRNIVIQLCHALSPASCGLRLDAAEGWSWGSRFPHADAKDPTREIVVCDGKSRLGAERGVLDLSVALAGSVEELPPGCETVVQILGPLRAEIVRSAVHERSHGFRPGMITAVEAERYGLVLRRRALAAGMVGGRRSIPSEVSLGALDRRPEATTGVTETLESAIGLGEEGEVSLDLVRAGPHAVIGGTTGSGKSELLATWVASMARTYSPAQVTFLLVDFKGGAAFRPLCVLPHCVGLITDLDGRQAMRALASLAAELRHRERTLRTCGARDLVEAGAAAALPRLVIVIDEFATMLDAFPELHALFVDVAARGRSLGVHLILCTQRPAGVVRDALLANCGLRVSLRVNNRADSQAVIGTDAAAAISPVLPGRCLVAIDVGGTLLCQVATTLESDIRAIADAAPEDSAVPSPRRPWLEPLPAVVTEEDLRRARALDSLAARPDADSLGRGRARLAPAGGLLLGLLDEPEHQRYRVADYTPRVDGNLLVIGGARTGKSSLLATLAAQQPPAVGSALVPADIEGTWDALEQARRMAVGGPGSDDLPRVLFIDDFDSVCARWDTDHRLAALELIAELLRDGPRSGNHLVIAVQRLAGALQTLQTLCQSTLLLRLPHLQDHLAAGGTAARFDDTLPPGGGTWRGTRVQLLAPREQPESATPVDAGWEGPALADPAPALSRSAAEPTIVVSGTPVRSIAWWRSRPSSHGAVVDITQSLPHSSAGRLELPSDPGNTVFVGDADAWQAQWALLGVLRPLARIVFDDCSLADFRLIARRRTLPPPVIPGGRRVWVLYPDGRVSRASCPD